MLENRLCVYQVSISVSAGICVFFGYKKPKCMLHFHFCSTRRRLLWIHFANIDVSRLVCVAFINSMSTYSWRWSLLLMPNFAFCAFWKCLYEPVLMNQYWITMETVNHSFGQQNPQMRPMDGACFLNRSKTGKTCFVYTPICSQLVYTVIFIVFKIFSKQTEQWISLKHSKHL